MPHVNTIMERMSEIYSIVGVDKNPWWPKRPSIHLLHRRCMRLPRNVHVELWFIHWQGYASKQEIEVTFKHQQIKMRLTVNLI
jgi:hypothetical protein